MCEVKLHKVEAISIGPKGPEMTPLLIFGSEMLTLGTSNQWSTGRKNGTGPEWPWSTMVPVQMVLVQMILVQMVPVQISEIVPVQNGLVGPSQSKMKNGSQTGTPSRCC